MLSSHSNLYVALRVEDRLTQVGSNELMPNRIVDSNGEIENDWLNLFTEYPDRFVIGADEFTGPDSSGSKGAPSMDSTWEMLEKLPDSIKTKMAGANALSIYGIL
jgi:hypothetical protein